MAPSPGIDLSRVIRFDIPAQDLGAALLSSPNEAQVQIIVESRLAESVSTTNLNGEYSRSSALEMLRVEAALPSALWATLAIAIQAAAPGERVARARFSRRRRR